MYIVVLETSTKEKRHARDNEEKRNARGMRSRREGYGLGRVAVTSCGVAIARKALSPRVLRLLYNFVIASGEPKASTNFTEKHFSFHHTVVKGKMSVPVSTLL